MDALFLYHFSSLSHEAYWYFSFAVNGEMLLRFFDCPKFKFIFKSPLDNIDKPPLDLNMGVQNIF